MNRTGFPSTLLSSHPGNMTLHRLVGTQRIEGVQFRRERHLVEKPVQARVTPRADVDSGIELITRI